jgi:hypothetical protein
MGVVIEICVKYPGGPTRITVADISAPPFQLSSGSPGCFTIIAITTPIAPALKNYYI